MDRTKSLQVPFVDGANADPIDAVPERALYPFENPSIRPSGAAEDLAFYRMEYPYVPIMQLPSVVLNKVLVANVAATFDIPDYVAIGMFKCNGDFWLSWQGPASIPVAGPSVNEYSMSPAVPGVIDLIFYVKNNKQFSVISANPVTVSFLGWPILPDLGGINNKRNG